VKIPFRRNAEAEKHQDYKSTNTFYVRFLVHFNLQRCGKNRKYFVNPSFFLFLLIVSPLPRLHKLSPCKWI
jgi:hypothetical protein